MDDKSKITVVIDVMGSDKGPATIVKGACQALEDSRRRRMPLWSRL